MAEVEVEEVEMVKYEKNNYAFADATLPLAILPRNLRTEETVEEDEGLAETHQYHSPTTSTTTKPPPPLSPPR